MHDDLRASTAGRHAGWRSILPAVFLLWWQGGAVAQQLPETAPEPAPQTDDAVPLPAGEPAAQVIEAEDAAQPTDAEIKSRLDRVFGNLPSLRGVSVRVSDGVIIMPGLLESPPPACLVETLEEGKTRLRLYGWIDQRESDHLKLKSEAQRLVREALEIPEEQELEEPRAARAPGEEAAPAERAIDTAPDRAIVQQMRAEKRDGDAADLLDQAAPRE